MADIKKNVTLRLTLENGNVVRAELEGLGKTGEGAGQRIERGIGGASAALRAFAPIVGGLSVAAMASFVKSAVDSVGALGEQAEQLGISTRALQVYQFAASQAGVKQEQLESGVSIFTATIGKAAEGNTEAVRSFQKLGIGILDFNGKLRASEDILADAAEAISREGDAARRAAIAKDLFGKSGQRLLPILSQGRAGLQSWNDEAERLGLIFGDDVIGKADKASDNIAKLEFSLKRLGQTVSLIFVPAITEGTDFLNIFARSTAEVLRLIEKSSSLLGRQTAFALKGPGVIEAEARARQLERDMAAARSSDRARGVAFPSPPVATRNPRTEEDIKRADQRAQAIGKVVAALEAELAAMQASEKERFVLQKLQAAGANLSEKEAAAIRAKAEALWEAQRAEKEAAERGRAIDKQLADEERQNAAAKQQSQDSLREGERKLFAEGIRLRESLRTPNEAYQAQLDKINELYDKGAISSETYLRAQMKALQDLSAAEDGAKEKAGGLTEVFEAMGQRTARALGDMAVGLNKNEDALDSFLRLLQTAGSDFISGVIAQQGTMPAFKSAGGWLDNALGGVGDFFSGLFHDGGIVGAPSAFRRVPAMLFAGAPRFHEGGIIGPGERPIIAKDDEEILRPDNPRHIRNAGAMPSIRLGDIYIDARGADAAVEARIRAAMVESQAQTVAMVEQLLKSGGSMSRAARLRG